MAPVLPGLGADYTASSAPEGSPSHLWGDFTLQPYMGTRREISGPTVVGAQLTPRRTWEGSSRSRSQHDGG